MAVTMTQAACGNTIINSTSSPDENYKIVIFERNCGATTGFSTQVSIMPSNEELGSKGGNIFLADDNQGQAKINESGCIDLEAEWLTSSTVVIRYDSSAAVYKEEKKYKGIEIEYSRVQK